MIKNFFISLIAFVGSYTPLVVLAQGIKDSGKVLKTISGKAGVTETNIGVIIGNGIRIALTLVGLIFLVLMVYAGFLWMTARGESEQVEKAKKIIYSSLIGLVIVLSAYAITYLVTSKFGNI